ncbi:hypothetical protein [Paractinoplanes lichenicola]|nr:hypothetical protein [Actinoplanes lichenicola]
MARITIDISRPDLTGRRVVITGGSDGMAIPQYRLIGTPFLSAAA